MAAKPQFSLRWLLAAIAAVALLFGEAVGFPRRVAEIAGLVITTLLLPVLLIGMVHTRGLSHAFCTGSLVCWFAVSWIICFSYLGLSSVVLWDGGRIDLCICWLLCGAGGLAAAGICWFTGIEG